LVRRAPLGGQREADVKACFNPPTIAPPGGVFSHCVRAGSIVFVSGMVGRDVERRIAGDDIASQARQALENVRGCIEAAGGSMADVCSVTTYLEHADRDFAAYNEVYREFFPTSPPARATVQAHMVGDVLIEIQAIAVLG
jgi:reactive intermediate/imine deaminase